MKKFLLMITIFLCISPTVFGADRYSYNTSWDDDYLGLENIKLIYNRFNYKYNNNDLNKFYDTFVNLYPEIKKIYPSVKLYNLMFYSSNTIMNPSTFCITISNGSFGNSSIPYIKLIEESNVTKLFWVNDINDLGIEIKSFNSYSSSLQNYPLQNGQYLATLKDDTYYFTYYIFSFFDTYTVYYNGKWGFLSDGLPGLLIAPGEYLKPEIPSEPENPSGDTPSGDIGGNDYTSQLNQIQENLGNIENKIPTSGDIEQATQSGVVQGSTDYWGSSGDMSGDKQEDLISGKVDELTEQISGDLAENEIFGVLNNFENKLFGGFTGEQDFKIEWNDVSYMGTVIIPKGEVNFSKICRENEVLGNVKTTINIILDFFVLLNVVIYLYNLLLSTLGIDNPYLYEKPEDVTTTTITTNANTGHKIMTTSTRKANGNTYNVRRSIR